MPQSFGWFAPRTSPSSTTKRQEGHYRSQVDYVVYSSLVSSLVLVLVGTDLLPEECLIGRDSRRKRTTYDVCAKLLEYRQFVHAEQSLLNNPVMV
jgi:hypothetical protein